MRATGPCPLLNLRRATRRAVRQRENTMRVARIVEAKAGERETRLSWETQTLSLIQINGKFENESLRIFCFGTASVQGRPGGEAPNLKVSHNDFRRNQHCLLPADPVSQPQRVGDIETGHHSFLLLRSSRRRSRSPPPSRPPVRVRPLLQF